MKKPEIEQLVSMISALNEIENLNYGGCGIVATTLYRKLEQLGQKPKIIVLTRTPDDIMKCVKSSVQSFHLSLSHVVCKLGKYYIDSTGFYQDVTDVMFSDGRQQVEVPIEWLEERCKYPNYWNDLYDRNNNTRIERMINQIKL